MVNTQLSSEWVNKAASCAFENMPTQLAGILGNIRRLAGLLMLEWDAIAK